jgi:hypothetical protein
MIFLGMSIAIVAASTAYMSSDHVVLEHVLPRTTPASVSCGVDPESLKKRAEQPRKATLATDAAALVQAMGAPVAFDAAFAEVQRIPRFKDEFETTGQFQKRQAPALAKCQPRYLLEVPVDPKYVRYDADKQMLTVATYALTNTIPTPDELASAFGDGSELSKAGVEVKYSTLVSGNVVWALPYEKKDVGIYDASNSFGVKTTVIKQEWIARCVFDREGQYRESVWVADEDADPRGSAPVAFEMKADPERARALKQRGLRAAILVAPKAPFHATGVDHFMPTSRAPFDRTTDVRYLVGDIQCAAIYDADGKLLAVRVTR